MRTKKTIVTPETKRMSQLPVRNFSSLAACELMIFLRAGIDFRRCPYSGRLMRARIKQLPRNNKQQSYLPLGIDDRYKVSASSHSLRLQRRTDFKKKKRSQRMLDVLIIKLRPPGLNLLELFKIKLTLHHAINKDTGLYSVRPIKILTGRTYHICCEAELYFAARCGWLHALQAGEKTLRP
ncbi:hypothetical protein BGX38DRAFT_773370 [Terfezia claveryi]|nr:hypothetical protein BGX38DRAFT_773370 [Terfezia claveryi]